MLAPRAGRLPANDTNRQKKEYVPIKERAAVFTKAVLSANSATSVGDSQKLSLL
jgi:hypothetical protein